MCYYLVLCALTRAVGFAAFVMLFYLTAQWCAMRGWAQGNFISHLCFRFVGYWWTCSVCLDVDWDTVWLHSLVYWTHISYTYSWAKNTDHFKCIEHYTRGCMELMVVLAGLLWLEL